MRVDGERLESRRSPQWVSHLANDKAKNGETMHTIEWHGRASYECCPMGVRQLGAHLLQHEN